MTEHILFCLHASRGFLLQLKSYHIIYFSSVDPYKIAKSMDIEMVTFLGLKGWDQHKVYNNHMVQYSFLKLQYNTNYLVW
jgi:hypothetical protein